tara:strand:+ start:1 stop:2859 length:2859 start_codon:yes stop_codon:yes gene_type:complete
MMAEERAQREARRTGILADDPHAIEHWLPGARAQTKAEYTGVDFTGGAEGDVIRQMSFLPTDLPGEVMLDSVQRVLQKNYEEQFGIERTYDYDVRVEPNTGDLIFNDPKNNNQPTVINPPGIDKGDFLAFIEPVAAEIGAAIGGGVVGGALTVGSPVGVGGGALVAETLATYIWRWNNLTWLDEQGYLPVGYDINTRAMKDAGMTALFSLGGVGLFKLVKKVMGVANLPNKWMLDEDEFVESYQKIANELGEDVSAMTTPQVMLRGADEGVEVTTPVQGLEAGLRDEASRGTPQGQGLREKYTGQEKIGVEEVDEAFAPSGQGITRDLVDVETGGRAQSDRGVEFREVAQEAIETNPRMVEAEKAITDLNIQTDNMFRGIADGSVDPNLAGRQLRETFQTALDTSRAGVDEAYERATKAAGFIGNRKPYDYAPLRDVAKKYKRLLKNQVFANRSHKAIINTALESLESGTKKSHKVFVNDLSNIRSIIRAEKAAGNNVEELVRLRDSMESIRRKTLQDSGNKDALKLFNEAEAGYRKLMEDFNNDQVKRLLNFQTVSNNLYRQGDKTAYNGFMSFLRNTVTKNTDGTISSPQFIDDVLFDPTNADGLLGIKGGLRQEYTNKVIDTTGDIFKPRSPKAHADFMRDNRALLEKFFTKDEMAEFANAEQFIKTFKARETALKNTRNALLRNTNLADIADNIRHPEDLFKNTWRPGGFTATKELFDAVSKHGSQDLINSYKAYIFKDIMDNTQRRGTLGKNIFDGNSLNKYIDDHGDALEVWFGNKFRKQLTDISTRLKAFDDPNVSALAAEDRFLMKSANSLARAYVGLFTTPGRVLTALKMIAGGTADNKQLALLTDPDKLYDAIMKDKWQKNPVVRGLVRELGRIYYREEEMMGPEVAPDITPEQILMKGPGSQRNPDLPVPVPELSGLNRTFRYGGHVVKNLGMPLKYRMDG